MPSHSWNKKDNDSVTTYNRADVEHDISASMNHDGMILFSLLSGADYNKVHLFSLHLLHYSTINMATRAYRAAVQTQPSA
jgi:hypothetical protein